MTTSVLKRVIPRILLALLLPQSSLSAPCLFCWGKSPFPDPDLELPTWRWAVREVNAVFLDKRLPRETVTCQEAVDLIVNLIASHYGEVDSESKECEGANWIGGICGCEPIENSCQLCRNGLVHKLPSLYGYDVDDCLLVDRAVTQYVNESERCQHMQVVWPECCSDFDDWVSFLLFNGSVDTKTKQNAIVWVPRATGFLSLLGSLTIIIDVIRSKENGKSVYHGLVLALSFFDIIISTCWILSTAPVEKDSAPWVPYAVGNERTCKAQGFFTQLGYIGSISHNLVLSVYYLLVIVYNKREYQMKKIRPWLHVPPCIVPLAMACAGIPFYTSISYMCGIAPPPIEEDWTLTILFSILPICLVFTASTIIMCIIYCSVRRKTHASLRWSIRSITNLAERSDINGDQSSGYATVGPRSSLSGRIRDMAHLGGTHDDQTSDHTTLTPTQKTERAVFWQAVFYVCAFFISWPVFVVGQLNANSDSYGLWITIAILTPLQGFINSLVYFRPRYVQYRAKKKRERDARRRLTAEAQTATTGSPELTSDEYPTCPIQMGQAQDDPICQLEYYRSEAEASACVSEDAVDTGQSSELHSSRN